MRVVSCSLKEEMKEGGKEGKKEGRKGRRTFIPLQRHGGAIPAIQKFATAACSTLHTSTQIICFKLLHVCVCVLLFLSLCTQGNWRCVHSEFKNKKIVLNSTSRRILLLTSLLQWWMFAIQKNLYHLYMNANVLQSADPPHKIHSSIQHNPNLLSQYLISNGTTAIAASIWEKKCNHW